ncbi:MAG: NUDIX hydrolase [Agathobacter sp.]|nr:NUDIX hydrolase [Agathobacter sp.]
MNVKKVYDNRFLKMYDIEHKEGAHYLFSSRRNEQDLFKMKPDAVSCVTVLVFPNGEAKLLLSYEYRYPIGHAILSPAAGCMDPTDESVEETAIREVYEELGLAITEKDKVQMINPMVFSSPGMTDESNALVLCLLHVDNENQINRDHIEGDELFTGYELLTKDQAREIIQNGVDKNGIPYPVYTWCALMYFISDMWK